MSEHNELRDEVVLNRDLLHQLWCEGFLKHKREVVNNENCDYQWKCESRKYINSY